MSNIEKAITLAREGGYKNKIGDLVVWEEIALDPLFWKALGKSCNWEGYFCTDCRDIVDNENALDHRTQKLWLWQWHRFIDWLAEGKEADEFFAELLSKV